MAISKNGFLFTKVDGSIGNVTATVDKAGRQILRERVTEVANPRSLGQVNQRNKFSVINSLASTFRQLVPKGWRNEPSRSVLLTPRNRFMSYNLKNAFMGAGADTLNLSNIRIGQGTLSSPGFSFSSLTNASPFLELNLTITANIGQGNADPEDLILFFAVKEEDNTLAYWDASERVDGAISINSENEIGQASGTWYTCSITVTLAEYEKYNDNVLEVLSNVSNEFIQSDFVVLAKTVIS